MGKKKGHQKPTDATENVLEDFGGLDRKGTMEAMVNGFSDILDPSFQPWVFDYSYEIGTTVLVGAFVLVSYLVYLEVQFLSQSLEKENVKEDVETKEGKMVEAPKPRRTNPAMELAKATAKKTEDSSCCGGGSCKEKDDETVSRVVVMYGTTTGNSEDFADKLAHRVRQTAGVQVVDTIDVAAVEQPEDHFSGMTDGKTCMVVVISTYTEGTPPESAQWFYTWLEESAKDFRVQHSMLKGLKYAVFGLGNSNYSDHYNVIGKQVDKS